MRVKLYPHQERAINELASGKILSGGVGTGKTLTAIAFFHTHICGGEMEPDSEGNQVPLKKSTDLYVITTAKKRDSLDWDKELALFGYSKKTSEEDHGFKIVIDSWHNIVKYKEVKDAFFIFDEQRLVGKGVWAKSFINIARYNRWVVLSATPGDVWSDYIPVFIANGFYRNRTDFNRRHVVFNTFGGFPKIERYLETKTLETLRSKILVDMPYERHTTRHRKYILAEYDLEKHQRLHKNRWNIFEDRPIENASELFMAIRRLTGSDPQRLNIIRDLMKKHDRIIIFYNFNHELEQLQKLKQEGIAVAEWNGHRHEKIPNTDRWLYLVQYAAGSEAWNCTSTDTMVFYSLNYSYKVMEQAEGRIDRLDTPYEDLWYYYILTENFLDKGILRALKKKKNFNESAWRRRYNEGIFKKENSHD